MIAHRGRLNLARIHAVRAQGLCSELPPTQCPPLGGRVPGTELTSAAAPGLLGLLLVLIAVPVGIAVDGVAAAMSTRAIRTLRHTESLNGRHRCGQGVPGV